jgi:hypothetical protein
MESSNRTTYICGICNTNPDQLSHHNAHLNSVSHKEKKIICEYEIRRYMLEFLFLVDDDYWRIYLQNEYFEERINSSNESFPIVEDWIAMKSVNTEIKYKLANCYDTEYWINKYKEETNKTIDLNDKIHKILFLDWKIKYLIKQAETIQKTSRKPLKHFDNQIINKINNNEITIAELINKLINEVCFNEGAECCHNEIIGNPNSTVNKHKKCITNYINLGYLIYFNFKDKIICKDVEIETITLGESRKSKRPMWFIRDDNSNHDQLGKIILMFKQFIKDLLNTTSLDEDKKNKLYDIIARRSSSFIIYFRELFR